MRILLLFMICFFGLPLAAKAACNYNLNIVNLTNSNIFITRVDHRFPGFPPSDWETVFLPTNSGLLLPPDTGTSTCNNVFDAKSNHMLCNPKAPIAMTSLGADCVASVNWHFDYFCEDQANAQNSSDTTTAVTSVPQQRVLSRDITPGTVNKDTQTAYMRAEINNCSGAVTFIDSPHDPTDPNAINTQIQLED